MTAPTRIEVMHKRHGKAAATAATCATCARCHLTPIGGKWDKVYKCGAYPDSVAAVYWDVRWPACGEYKT